MNDDVEGAEAGLAKGTDSNISTKLGRGVVTFLRATLGFEQDVMREASDRLAEAEASASNDQRRAQRDRHSDHSVIYPPGSEFALCHAESQLMSAVVGVLNESLTESIRGFYKLRKAYITLDGLLEAENRFIKGKNPSGMLHSARYSTDSLKSNKSTLSYKSSHGMPGGFGQKTPHPVAPGPTNPAIKLQQPSAEHAVNLAEPDGDDDEDEFFDADETHEGARTPVHYLGHLETETPVEKMKDLSLDHNESIGKDRLPQACDPVSPATPNSKVSLPSTLDVGPDSSIFANPVDMFIHSGSNLCYGLLLLLISMIPPAFSKLLFIIGFKGDRERGIKMMWQASKFHNINGAMSGLILLGYYNGVIGFCDILPDSKDGSLEGYPKEECEALLADMRVRHPKSQLWMLEEARMHASNKELEESVKILSGNLKSPLKQVEALGMFEKSLVSMYLHDYELCAKSFIKCVDLNNWSHALYYYIAGAAYVELYRQFKTSDPTKARTFAAKAEELLKVVPKHTGKKKFMARQLPFDIFVLRKLHKWEQRATEWKVDFIDAIGVSPIEEMIYFWNGYKRMRMEHLDKSLACLSWSSSSENPNWDRESLDEQAIQSVLRAAVLRNMRMYPQARQLLSMNVINHDRLAFKGHLKDDWTCPTAHYEMAANFWMERDGGKDDADRIRSCGEWLDKVAKWESYELDARIGLKVTTAQDTLKKYGYGGPA
ncbi:MAG: Mitochondrial outer membrane protein iml2 [Candelina mexicana]|nr:MAG: Mitochondrial outer membrane protein iml2 [Candelina mexicana]